MATGACTCCARSKGFARRWLSVLNPLLICYGSEFAGRILDQWAYLNGVEIDFSRPEKPTDNGHIEAFNGRLRAECLNASWFLSLADVKDRIEEWRRHYNEERPHSALGSLTPRAYIEQHQSARKIA